MVQVTKRQISEISLREHTENQYKKIWTFVRGLQISD